MTDSLEDIILNNLVTNEGYARKVLPHIKPEYFEGAYRSAFELVCSFVAKYNTAPNTKALLVEFGKSSHATQQNANDIVKIIQGFESNIAVDENWLIDSTELHCKDRAIYLAIMESISIIDGSNPDKPQTSIPAILSDALGVSFDSHIGHDYILDAQERWEFYNRIEDKTPFDIEMLNEITNGGLTPKTLNVILAGTGVGKSLGMCHIAAQNLSYGKDVLYITLEMAEERIAERIDANLLDIDIARMKETSNSSFTDKIGKIAAKTNGRLIIKEYPTGGAHAGHFRALLQDLKLKKKFVPQLIIIDYLNICASSRLKGASAANSYTLIKSTAEELRGLGVEHNAAILTATQVTRAGFAASDVEITDTSECIVIDEEVKMRDGSIKKIGEINIGDQVKANDEYKTVMFRHHNKIKDCIEIETVSGKRIRVSKDHIFPTKTKDGIVKRLSYNDGLSLGDKLSSSDS